MNLSAEVFQSVVQALRVETADDCADATSSTLCARRVRLGGRAVIIPCAGESAGEPVLAVARDVSPSGIALTVPLRLTHGDRFILHLPSICGCLVRAISDNSILCTVARYQYTGDALYTVGATFTRVLCNPKVLSAEDGELFATKGEDPNPLPEYRERGPESAATPSSPRPSPQSASIPTFPGSRKTAATPPARKSSNPAA